MAVSFDAMNKSKSLFDFDGKEAEPSASASAEAVGVTQVPVDKTHEQLEAEGDEAFDKGTVVLRSEQSEFNKQKAQLRSYFKQLKVGLVKWEQIPQNYQKLLIRYYGL